MRAVKDHSYFSDRRRRRIFGRVNLAPDSNTGTELSARGRRSPKETTTLDQADDFGCAGFCEDCDRIHSLPVGQARFYAENLMREFECIQRLDYLANPTETQPRLSFHRLFPRGRGHMFGVLECQNQQGERVVLRAFSSLHDGIREVEGWVPPLLSAENFFGTVLPAQKVILELTEEIKAEPLGSISYQDLLLERKAVSQQLLQTMQALYRFHNFRGEARGLKDAFLGSGRIPGGVGECCAPKLLNHAVLHKLKPLGIAEFYWGGVSASGKRRSGQFYSACASRCEPVLGFMLCGLDHVE